LKVGNGAKSSERIADCQNVYSVLSSLCTPGTFDRGRFRRCEKLFLKALCFAQPIRDHPPPRCQLISTCAVVSLSPGKSRFLRLLSESMSSGQQIETTHASEDFEGVQSTAKDGKTVSPSHSSITFRSRSVVAESLRAAAKRLCPMVNILPTTSHVTDGTSNSERETL